MNVDWGEVYLENTDNQITTLTLGSNGNLGTASLYLGENITNGDTVNTGTIIAKRDSLITKLHYFKFCLH